jgi:hypothetical protein
MPNQAPEGNSKRSQHQYGEDNEATHWFSQVLFERPQEAPRPGAMRCEKSSFDRIAAKEYAGRKPGIPVNVAKNGKMGGASAPQSFSQRNQNYFAPVHSSDRIRNSKVRFLHYSCRKRLFFFSSNSSRLMTFLSRNAASSSSKRVTSSRVR